jgi:predicted nucleic acid-binding protein
VRAILVESNVLLDVLTDGSSVARVVGVAGKCFLRYRRRGRARLAPLADFYYIGAHAAVAGMTLLTRDARRYRTYFPGLSLVAPA